MKLVTLAGGVGASKFLRGLIETVPQEDITIIGNIGDDERFHGLYVSPDLDIVIYALADMTNPSTGWGLKDDTFNALSGLKRFGCETWFNLGDQDLATHIYRTQRLREGVPLHTVTAEIAAAFGLHVKIIPVSNTPVPTIIHTPEGELRFEEYFVKHRFEPVPIAIEYRGVANVDPAPGVLAAIHEADAIIIAPSNPIVSINPILSVPGVRDAIIEAGAPKIAISPIVGGRPLKGPADRLLDCQGYAVTVGGIAQYYKGLITHLIIDNIDASLRDEVSSGGVSVRTTNTIMETLDDKVALARTTLAAIGLA